jgi:hypothetical protein
MLSPGNTENAPYWFGKVFSRIRYKLTVFWLAETNRARGVLVSIGLDLALAVGVFIFILCLRGNPY